jgi:hypothetical protein
MKKMMYFFGMVRFGIYSSSNQDWHLSIISTQKCFKRLFLDDWFILNTFSKYLKVML